MIKIYVMFITSKVHSQFCGWGAAHKSEIQNLEISKA